MSQVVILGGGTAGTIVANRLRRRLASEIAAGVTVLTLIDRDDRHVYQPGLLFVPFGIYQPHDIVRSRRDQLHHDVVFRPGAVARLLVDLQCVELTTGERIRYDVCVVATGAELARADTEGLTGLGWGSRVFDFYSLESAIALARALATWRGGRLVINVVATPIKHPVAPLEFAFLADWYFTMRGMRGDVDITYVTPLDTAFDTPACTRRLGHLLLDKGISLVNRFRAIRVDGDEGWLYARDDRIIPFDLLVTVPVHHGARFVRQTPGLGDDAGFVMTDPRTLQSTRHPAIFAVGDAADLPASKVSAVAHFEGAVLEENVVRYLDGVALAPAFDGHGNCFLETGFEKALLLDFTYDTEPHPGKFPFETLGPLSLMQETHLNHLGRMAFKWIYWNLLLPGRDIPGLHPRLSRRGTRE